MSAAYSTYLLAKMDFHSNHPKIEGTISLEKYLEEHKSVDKSSLILVSQLLDLQQSCIEFQSYIFKQLDLVDCKICCMIPLVIESYNIYLLTVHLLKQLANQNHDVFPAMVDRFNKIYPELRKFYFTCSNIKYITSIIAVPNLSEKPPSFLSEKKERKPKPEKKIVVEEQENPFLSNSQLFDMNFSTPDLLIQPQIDQRYEELMRRIRELEMEIARLREENERLREENYRLRLMLQSEEGEKRRLEEAFFNSESERKRIAESLALYESEKAKLQQSFALLEAERKKLSEENLNIKRSEEEIKKLRSEEEKAREAERLKQDQLRAEQMRLMQEENAKLKQQLEELKQTEEAMMLIKGLSGPTPEQLKLLGEADERVKAFIQKLIEASKSGKPVEDDNSGVDLEGIAERELINAAKMIEDAVKQLELQNQKKLSEIPTGEIDVESSILTAVMAITKATQALMKAAAEAQKERKQDTLKDPSKRYHKDPMWVEGLISAARAVAEATRLLVQSANDACQGRIDEAALIAASKAVAASTAQLVAATRAKSSDPFGTTQKNLDNAANAVTKATQALVKAAQQSIQNQEEQILLKSANIAEGVKQEIDQQAKILRLEKELETERKALFEMRKQKYSDK